MNNFKIQNYILETVKYFCYIGVTVRYNGNSKASPSLLMEKTLDLMIHAHCSKNSSIH